MSDTALAAAQAELGDLLAGVAADPPPSPFELGDRPRCIGGVLVPSSTVTGHGRVEYIPLGRADTITTARRSILTYRSGRPVLLWVGDDQTERDAALFALLGEIADHRGRRRG